ncbi:2Fe-2S iron-sulfur cluster binding domain-containing protein [Sphingobium sufflavum]|uniref:2Fe-2S iron-sulfur cluster-binding protein n=1 Tax=Sphingobium sufflavum TaxID=1129547 RepID=UPI001F439878|nr:2Fe-2S iron-sulfur cluster binding domain-containing protein [Sphingobium sufflavum]MCE7795828.1 2Fe-2S iron-sulfur cluster binding domain-containing protein [Sphingobium sufflavum]
MAKSPVALALAFAAMWDQTPYGYALDDGFPLDDGTAMTIGDAPITLTIIRRGQTVDMVYDPGAALLGMALDAGVNPPFSCLGGACATCIARVTKGTATMIENNVLSEEERADGYILTCQAIPTSPHVTFIYED